MKRVLLATTALAATAGMAAAEITWGGYGRFGILYDSENKVEVKTQGTPAMYRTGLVEIDLKMAKDKVIKDKNKKVIGLPSAAEFSPLAEDKEPEKMKVSTAVPVPTKDLKDMDLSAEAAKAKKIVRTFEIRGGRLYGNAKYYEDAAGKTMIANTEETNVELTSDEAVKMLADALYGLVAGDYAATPFVPKITDFVDGLMVTQTFGIGTTESTVMHQAKVPGMSLPAIPAVPAKVAKMEKRSVRIESRFRINVNASATADNGTVFSAFVRMQADDKADGSAGEMGLSGVKFSVMANGLKLDAGNAGGAIDGMPNYYGAYPNVGLSMWSGQFAAVDYKIQEFASGGAGDNGVNLGWSSEPFSLAVSGRRVAADTASEKISGSEIAAHIAYSAGNMAFALGHSTSSDMKQESITVASAKFSSGPVSFTLLAGDEDIKTMLDGDMEAKTSGRFYGASATFAASDAVTIGVNYGSGSGDHDASSYGLGMTYSLGGGVSLKGGVRRAKDPDHLTVKTAYTMADLGVQFNF